MPKAVTEFFNGGLVNSRHPSLLNPGELQRADDTVYREKDPAIWRAPGRTAYNSTALGSPSAIKGIRHLTFDNQRTDQLIVYCGTALFRSDFTAITGTFSEIGGPGQVVGTISATVTFTATTGFPFLADIVGARLTGTGITANATVTAVSNQSGTTGHYSTITISTAQSNGTLTLSFDFGVVQALQDSGTEILDSAQWQSRYYMWFNHGAPRRVAWRSRPTTTAAGSLTDILNMRPIGLNAVRQAPTIATISGVWNALLGTGYYWFLITEIYAPGGDVTAAEKDANLAGEIVESAYLAPDPTSTDPNSAIGRPISVSITNTATQGVRITLPAVINTGVDGRLATNWGIYMAGPTQDGRTVPSLASFKRVRTNAITTYAAGATLDLTEPTLAPQLKYATTRTSDDGKSEFANAANMTGAPDKQVGFAKSGSATDAPGVQDAVEKLGGWSFDTSGSYATATITGIEVQVTGSADSSGNAGTQAGYYVHVDTAAKHTPLLFSVFGAYGTIYHGGTLDTIGVAWVIGDLATITVTVGKTGTGSRQRLAIDSVGLKIYFGGGTINLDGPAYRVVTYRDQVGTTVNDPANLPPPECSTGDVWAGSLVLNDLANESAIRYSLPGRPEAFPKPYILQFESIRKDKVTVIKTLGQSLIVGLRDSIKRVNYLPRETDTDFQQGLAHEDLATDHGIAGPLAATKFDMPGAGTMLAYASYAGMFLTNAVTTRPISLDLNWTAMVNLANLSSCVVRVYPKEKWIVLYYNPAGASHTSNTRALIFSYAMDKVKEGGFLPVTGPISVLARSACEANLSGTPYLVSGHGADGKLYIEDNGVAQPATYQNYDSAGTLASAPITPIVRTRLMYAGGIERSGMEERIYVLFSKFGTSTNASSTTTRGSITVTSSAAFASVVPGMRVTGTGIDLNTIVIAKASSSSITLSRAANTTGTATLTFDTGTVSVTVRGADLAEDVYALETTYISTLLGHLYSTHSRNTKLGLELEIQKVMLPDASSVDLGVNMCLHQFTYLLTDSNQEQDRYRG